MPRVHVLLALAAAVAAGEPESKHERRITKPLRVDLPCERLELADGVEVFEARRSKRDAFPYLVVRREGPYFALTPETLAHFLPAPAIRKQEEALEAVRLFVRGPLVRTKEAVERIVAEARALPKLPYPVKVTDYRPKRFAPVVMMADGKWLVSLVALEMAARLRLVHVTARVSAAGGMEIERVPIVDGPFLSWQTAFEGEPTKEDLARERKAREAVRDALLRCAKAARFEPDADTAWALGRVLRKLGEVREILGDPHREWGETARMWQYNAPDGSTITFSAKAGKEAIAFVGRTWTVRDGDIRATRGHTYRAR